MLTLNEVVKSPIAYTYFSVAYIDLETDHTQIMLVCIESVENHTHGMQVTIACCCTNINYSRFREKSFFIQT